MKIVIDIDQGIAEEIVLYERIPKNYENTIIDALRNGTPFLKVHGRLMILSENRLKENQVNLDSSCQKWISEVGLSNATVAIIPAVKE